MRTHDIYAKGDRVNRGRHGESAVSRYLARQSRNQNANIESQRLVLVLENKTGRWWFGSTRVSISSPLYHVINKI
jgi:hypothetical protein